MKKKAGKKELTDEATLSKEQDAVARYVRFNCPTSTTMFQGNEVHYFTGSKAVDTLIDSKYGSKAKNEATALFPNRQSVVNYMRELMNHQLFFRARKLVPKKKDDKEKKDKEPGRATKTSKEERRKKDDDTLTETEAEDKKEEKNVKESEEKKDDDEKKKKKKVKLEVHDVQIFSDDKDVYVWVFDPTPLYKKVIGLCMVLGTIVGCLFPLWPIWLRQGVYYVSLGGIGLFGAIVVVAILRTMLFGIIWLVTMGQHKLWILPNLTEDCGFLESFQPWYTYEYCPRGEKGDRNGKKKKPKKAKESDDEKEDKSTKDSTSARNNDKWENGAGEISKSEETSSAASLPKKKDKSQDARNGDKPDVERIAPGKDSGSLESHSEDLSESEELSSAPPSPEQGIRKRRARRADGDYVIVKK